MCLFVSMPMPKFQAPALDQPPTWLAAFAVPGVVSRSGLVDYLVAPGRVQGGRTSQNGAWQAPLYPKVPYLIQLLSLCTARQGVGVGVSWVALVRVGRV